MNANARSHGPATASRPASAANSDLLANHAAVVAIATQKMERVVMTGAPLKPIARLHKLLRTLWGGTSWRSGGNWYAGGRTVLDERLFTSRTATTRQKDGRVNSSVIEDLHHWRATRGTRQSQGTEASLIRQGHEQH